MTTVSPDYAVCGVCGSTVRYLVLTSTNAFGSSDLDLRPPEMQRSTMHLWVWECPNCGYTASDISDAPSFPREFLSSPRYTSCDGLIIDDDLARRFYRQHLCAAEEGDLTQAADALLHAAWSCDDSGDDELAVLFRRKAVEFMDRELKELPEEKQEQRMVQRADLLRRSRQFSRLIDEYSALRCREPIHRCIVSFQLMLAKRKDVRRYTVQLACDRMGFSE